MAKLIADATTDKILEFLAEGTTVATESRYFCLFNGDPAGAGTEVTSTITGAATRVDVSSSFGAPTTVSGYRQIANNAVITITSSAVGAATATYGAFFDAATGGNRVASYALDASLSIAIGNAVELATGAATLSFGDPA